ncbi:MAG: sigma-54-dependent Fis family transcriptional regulator, partial [Calditrichaeota bacterium]
IHRQSPRAQEVFIAVDMGALTETLFESELFGHVKGAFTDARKDRPGRFEIASGGTLFLDEIGNLPLPLQAKLLTVLEKREVIRVGSNTPHPIDVRLICATNLPIHQLVAEKKFRQDLLYRINTVEIQLPPLRERMEDIPLLAEHFLTIFCKKYHKERKRISPAALKKLEKYPWPGNVRELQHAIERAVIMSEEKVLQPSDFFFLMHAPAEEALHFEYYNLEEVEKIVIQKALNKHQGNISRAARELGLTRTSLYRRMAKYGL